MPEDGTGASSALAKANVTRRKELRGTAYFYPWRFDDVGPNKQRAIGRIVDDFIDFKAAICAHVGYVEDWRKLAIVDSRDDFWAANECVWLKYSANREAVEFYLTYGFCGEYGNDLYSDDLYSNALYSNAPPKQVYRGSELTLVVVVHTDGNQVLRLLDNSKEVK